MRSPLKSLSRSAVDEQHCHVTRTGRQETIALSGAVQFGQCPMISLRTSQTLIDPRLDTNAALSAGRYSVSVHEAAAIAVGALLRALVTGGFYAERDLAGAVRLAAVAVTELPNSMVRRCENAQKCRVAAHHIKFPVDVVTN